MLAWSSPLTANEPLNLSAAKRRVTAYVESGEYGKAVVEVALKANKHIIRRAERGGKRGEKMAVIFDIDETAITNLTHMQAMDFGYVPRLWQEWVDAGQGRAIIPVQTVYDTAVRLKVAVIFVTGRRERDRAGTERNLREVGYETWAQIHFTPDEFQGTAQNFKTGIRRKLIEEGYVIIANLGDQWSDLNGGHAEKVFKLPNPFYSLR